MTTAREASVRRLFSRLAPHYARLNTVLSFGLHKLWRRCAMASLPLQPGDLVLDLCAGTGDFAVSLRQRGARVIAVDLAEPMLAIARHRTAGQLPLLVADVLHLPIADGVADGVTLGFGLRHSEADLPLLLAEVRRALKPGGTVVILELSHPPLRLWKWASGIYIHHVLPLVGALVDAEAYRYLSQSLNGYPNAEELQEMLLAVGFSACQYRLLAGGIAAIHVAVA